MINKVLDKVGSGGVWLAALSCTACFPALGSLASALGLGFLATFEGIAVNTLLPVFATLALIVNLYAWFKNKHHLRGILSVAGPIAVLLTLYPFWQYAWSTYLFYCGIGLMVIMSIVDMALPIKDKQCKI
jgi:mercuric ion transport protein